MFQAAKKLSCALLILLQIPCVVSAEDEHVEGEVLVTFKENVETGAATATLNRHSLRMAEHYDKISLRRHRVAGLVRQKSRSTAQLIETLKADPIVETVEPNYIRHITATVPNDSDFSKLWALQNTGQTVNATSGTSGVDTKFLAAWRLARPAGAEVVIGVIDTGVDISHPDLAANIWTNPTEIAGNGIDDDTDGYTDDVHGYDFASSTAALSDSGSHGTHVAGTIGAVGKNSAGVIGMDFRAKILPMKVSTDGDTMTTSAVLAAYNYALTLKQKGINIVALNASFGGTSFSSSEQSAIAALRDAGIILCAAAGNGGSDGVGDNNDSGGFYPANYTLTNIISVAALTQSNTLASFSNYGATSVDLAAPGVNIYSTAPLSLGRTSSLTVGTTTYLAQELLFSGTTSAAGLTKPIYNCGIGNPNEFPAGVSGNLALIQRGTLTFAEKVTNAMSAGAVGAIIYDHTTEALGGWTLGTSGNWIPSLQITKAAGEALLTQLATPGKLINSNNPALAYQFLDGTSMATPQVTGAIAFAALNFPAESMSQRVSRILTHVTPVAALSGKMTTGGRLDLLNIVDTDGDGLPDWWETDNFGNLAQTAAGDPDGDGFTSFQEFLTGTSPVTANSHLAFSASARGSNAAANNFILTFPSVQDTIYQVEWSNNLSTWAPLGSAVTGTGSPIQVTDSNALNSSAKRFYRLALAPQ